MLYRRRALVVATAIVASWFWTSGATPDSVGATLSERLSAFSNAFKKEEPQPQTQAQAQPNRSQRAVPSRRNNRSSYARTQQRNYSRNRAAQRPTGNPSSKSSLSSLFPQNLFGKKKTAADEEQSPNTQRFQTSTPNRNPQQRNVQQGNSQSRTAQQRSQQQRSVQQRPQPQRSAPSRQIAIQQTPVQQPTPPTKPAVVRKSPQLLREDDLQEALVALKSDTMLPDAVVDDSTNSAQVESALATDEYIDFYEVADEQTVASDEPAVQIESDNNSITIEDLTESIAEDQPELDAESIVQDIPTNDDRGEPSFESFAVISEEPADVATAESVDEPEFSATPAPESLATDSLLPQQEESLETKQLPIESVVAETPFGHSALDVHDALLSEELYVEQTEPVVEVARESEPSPEPVESTPVVEAIAGPVQTEAIAPETAPSELAISANSAEQAFADTTAPVKAAETEIVVDDNAPNTQNEVPAVETIAEAPQVEAEAAIQTEVLVTDTTMESEPLDTFETISDMASESAASSAERDPEQETVETRIAEIAPEESFADVVDRLKEQSSKLERVVSRQAKSAKPLEPTTPNEPVEATAKRREVVRKEFGKQQKEPREVTRLIRPRGDVLTSAEQPVIMSHVEGPRSILVGKEANYRVVLENTSQTAAQNLSATVKVPEWADLVDVVCSDGIVEQTREEGSPDILRWHLPELSAHDSQTLQLELIPRSGRAFQLGVQWRQETATSETVVEVREPKLEMKINGPEEVLFGDPQRYRLVVENPGNGPAENVALTLIPPGSDSADAKPHPIGTLGPGEVKEIELELTARETGEMVLQANAEASGQLRCEAIKRVRCQKPELDVDWRGPEQKYAGTETPYYFRVKNPGTATTHGVRVKVRLPEGINFISASDSFSYDATSGLVTWRLDELAAGEEQFMQFRCELDRPGLKEFQVEATGAGGSVRDIETVRTEVVALADLKLEVRDPRGAHPTGEPVTYEIRVENRGSSDAQGISIVGLFSQGIDPVSVEGGQSTVRDGRVNFQSIKSLPPGGEILLRIRAVASDVGTHVFRAEVSCHDLDIELAAEETTRFFKDEFQWGEGKTPYTATRSPETSLR